MKLFLITIFTLLKQIFSKNNLIWHALAIISTYLLVITGFDWKYFLAVRNESLNSFFNPALFGGFILPFIIPTVCFIIGAITKKKIVTTYGLALSLSALLGWLVSSTYKAFTGRFEPNIYNLAVDSSHLFHFGFWEHGIFWGWPSSHTTVAFAMSFAILTLLPKKVTLGRILIFTYALYVGVGVSLRIHWFSDFIAGAIIGTLVGIVVGTYFKNSIKSY